MAPVDSIKGRGDDSQGSQQVGAEVVDAVVGQLTMPRVQQLGGRVARPCQVIQNTQQDGCQVIPATESPLTATCPQQKTWDTAEYFLNDYQISPLF